MSFLNAGMFAVLCSANVLHAQTIGEPFGSFDEPGVASARSFGRSIDATEDYLLVGSLDSDNAGGGSGAAYLFDAKTREFIMALEPNDYQPSMDFGADVYIDGDRAIVGAPNLITGGFSRGAAYIFDLTTGDQISKMTISDGEQLGIQVALAGDRAFVAVESDEDFRDGAVYVFDAAFGDEITKLTPSNSDGFDRFGSDLQVADGTLYVGRPAAGASGSESSRAAVFRYDIGTLQPLATLRRDETDPLLGRQFGRAVALDGDRIVVGAPGDSEVAISSGAIYVFDLATMQRLGKAVPDDGVQGGAFGEALGVTDTHYIVGSAGASQTRGAVYFVRKSDLVIDARVIPADIEHTDRYGAAIAVGGGRIATGSRFTGIVHDLDPAGDPCRGDCDNSRTIDFTDLVTLLFRIGSDITPSAPCDVNLSGTVDFSDLVAALFAFGPCP